MNRHPGHSVHRLVLALAAAAVLAAARPLPAPELPNPDVAAQAERPKAADGPSGQDVPDDPLIKAILDLKFNRDAAGAVQAIAAIGDGEAGVGEGVAAQTRRYFTLVRAGDWAGVTAFIAALPAPGREPVYDHLVEHLGAGVLLPGDVLAVAEACPVELDERRVRALGRLLSGALELVKASGSLIAQLEAGRGRFGGKDAAGRGRAADLLLAADRIIEAGRFLPPLAPALAAGDLPTVELHARYLHAQARRHGEARRQAWDCDQAILAHLDAAGARPAPPGMRARAIERCFACLEQLPEADATAWLDQLFRARPATGRAALAAIAERVGNAFESKDHGARRHALAVQARVVGRLISTAGAGIGAWRSTLDLLAVGWLREAELAMRGRGAVETDDNDGGNRRGSNEPHPLYPADLLAAAPDDAWLGAIDSALAQRLRGLIGGMVVRAGNTGRTIDLIATLARDEPERAAALVRDLMQVWTLERGDVDRQAMVYRATYARMTPQQRFQYQQYFQQQSWNRRNDGQRGQSKTRASQERDLKELAALVTRLRGIGMPPPSELAAQAFTACHSPAEVFRAEDIAAVFGDTATLEADLLLGLADSMRQALAGTWRKPAVQQQAGTRRSDAETAAEAARGYELALSLIGQALARFPDAWQLHLLHGTTAFDFAEFQYGRKVPLATYTGLRDRAFAAFARGAGTYAATSPPNVVAVDAHVQWFQAALGASDLAYLTRQHEADADQVAKVRAALLALAGARADRHLVRFAEQVQGGLPQVPGELKPRFVRQALRVLGDHAAGEFLMRLLALYDELAGEAQLALEVDGDSAVGTQPFGVRVSLRHTAVLGRESNGFGRYLQNQAQHRSGTSVNHRNDFEKALREVLAPRFTIHGVVFHPPEVATRGFGRPGWEETPLAYVALSAKDAAVDRLPAARIDLDFTDGNGLVILPVSSPVVAIDARGAAGPRPTSEVAVAQILDARALSEGEVTVEVQATGKGVLPTLDHLLDLAVPGFALQTTDDHGPSLSGIDDSGERPLAMSERRWRLRYAPTGDASVFRFPTARAALSGQTWRTYLDADLVDAKPEVALGLGLRRRFLLPGLGIGALVILVVAAVLGWRRRRARNAPPPRYAVPGESTPFAVAGLLRRIAADPSVRLDAATRAQLDQAVADLDRRFFARDGVAGEDLAELATRWVRLANAG